MRIPANYNTFDASASQSLRSLHFLSITSECLRQGLQGIASLGTVTTFEYQPLLRDSSTSFYPFQFNCVILATSVRSWPGDPSTPEGCSQAAPGQPLAQRMGTQPPQHWSPENPTLPSLGATKGVPELWCCAWRANCRWPARVGP